MVDALPGLARLAERYTAFLIDQFGVLHDGHTASPDAIQALDELVAAGRQVVVLSNSGRRASSNRERLASFGFATHSDIKVVTSGEAAWQALQDGRLPTGAGRRHYVVAADEAAVRQWSEGVDPQHLVASLDQADVVLLMGIVQGSSLADHTQLLDDALARGLPMVCGNPDMHGPGGSDGGLLVSPGAIAAAYADMGGTVHYYGKPHAPIFAQGMACLDGVDKSQAVMIGDNIATDVDGARGFGIDCALICSGVHASELQNGAADMQENLAAIARRHDAALPNYTLDRFSW